MTRNKTRISCALIALVMLLGCFVFPNPTDTDVNAAETHYLYEDMSGLSNGQINIMKRARQMLEIKWTPMMDIYAWKTANGFKAGTTYTGVPYGQPVMNYGYIGYNIDLDGFLDSLSDADSKMYTAQGNYYGNLAPYYSTDCSGFVSYALELKNRHTTWSLDPTTSSGDKNFYKVENQSLEGMEVGDIFNLSSSHVLLIGGMVKNKDGKVVAIETLEQTPTIAVHTVWKDDTGDPMNWHTLKYFKEHYFDNGYVLFRYKNRDNVTYTHSCAVPIDGDYCAECKDPAPVAITKAEPGCKTITLQSSGGGTIFYTLDGSTPTSASKRYTSGQAIKITSDTQLKAVTVGGPRGQGRILTYNITIPKAATPAFTAATGYVKGDTVTKGTTVALTCSSTGAKIYYTLDGNAPDEHSLLYSDPIKVTDGLVIRAIAIAPGYKTSAELRATFKVAPLSYGDVAEDKWYTEAVEYVTARGLFAGTGEGNFSPDAKMNRAMFVTVLGRLAGVSKDFKGTIGIVKGNNVNVRSGPNTTSNILTRVNSGEVGQVVSKQTGWYKVKFANTEGFISADYFTPYEGQFADVPQSSYYNIYVQWAYLMGITNGTDASHFSPESNVTRQDMCCLLARFADKYGIKISGSSNGKFADDNLIASYAKNSVYAMKNAGVVNGVGDGRFEPTSDATRAQVAQIFTNFCQKVYH